MAIIYLSSTTDRITLVDDDIAETLGKLSWSYSPGSNDYVHRRQCLGGGRRRTQTLHRVIMGEPVGMCVDHINGDRLDNRRENLRICTNAENIRNSKKYASGKTSRYKGVCRVAGGFAAHIREDGRVVRQGCFETEIEAAIAYNQAALRVYGEFARLNNIDPKDVEKVVELSSMGSSKIE